jgi:hypothetical protein
LHKSRPFIWREEVEEAFQELKRYLISPPIMVAPEPGEPLLLYITATANAISMVLVVERPNHHRHQQLREPLQVGQDPRIQNQQTHQEKEMQSSPMNRRQPQLPSPKMVPSLRRKCRVLVTRKPPVPNSRNHLRVLRVANPRSPNLWRWMYRTP